ncbi:MAG: lipoate--protein ligase family protein [Verrucomicrobiae bacterium]|nr:lipoate--protein ligase family protein [Verrucomicrobiae bacterium]
MKTETWHWLDTSDDNAAMNMAIDDALLQDAERRGIPLVRVYGWTRSSISIGYFQDYPAEFESTHDIVRRSTGGGMVFHGKDLTFTFVAPRQHPLCRMNAADGYRELHALIAQALVRDGIAVTLQQSRGSTEQGACFELPVAHDIMIGAKKITGGAQRRTKSGLLHQGSLLLPPSLRKSLDELKAALRQGIPVTWIETQLSEKELANAADIARSRYVTEAWNKKFAQASRSEPRLRER